MKILIIDDDIDLLEITARRIGKKGLQNVTASDIKYAEEILEKTNDLEGIICDLFLKNGENGLDFYEKTIRKKFPYKFVLATGDKDADARIKKFSKEDKLFFSVEKPYSIDEVIAFFQAP